jgi:hypothetical protein
MYKLNETYSKMIERIDLFEKECLTNQVWIVIVAFIFSFFFSKLRTYSFLNLHHFRQRIPSTMTSYKSLTNQLTWSLRK